MAGSDTSVLLGNGDGTFQPPIVSHFGAALGQLVDFKLADVNGDGNLDIVAVNSFLSQAVLSVALGNSDGTFHYPYAFNAPAFLPNSIVLGDFNGDGILDAAIASSDTTCGPGGCSTTGAVTIFLGTGGGLFGAPTFINPVRGAESIAVGDFNGDGIPDLLTVNVTDRDTTHVSDSISVFFGNGDGTFQEPAYSPRPPAVLGPAVVADFTGDGILDVAALSSLTTNAVEVFLGNGDGTFQAPLSLPVEARPTGLVAGDFNGDGFLDLATANFRTAGDVSVLINAADWSSPTSGFVRPPLADQVANEIAALSGVLRLPLIDQIGNALAVPSLALRSPSPWAVAATASLPAARPSAAHDPVSWAWARGARPSGHAAWADRIFLPAGLLDDAPRSALDEGEG